MYYGNLFIKRDLTVHNNTDICGNLTVAHDVNATNFRASGNFYLDGYVLVPAGTIIMSASLVTPAGYLMCDGSAYTKTVYSDLFAVIGNQYGVYSGADLSFVVPNMVGRVAVGKTNSTGTSYSTIGATGGAETHTLTEQEMPSHRHTYLGVSGQGNSTDMGSSDTVADEQGRPTENTGYTGGNQPHNNMQPYMVLRYLIKY